MAKTKTKNPFNNLKRDLELIGRKRELSLLNESIKRGQNIVIYAPRGEGKTALFNQLCSQYNSSNEYVVMRCDLMQTRNMNDFVQCLIKSLKPFKIIKDFLNILHNAVPRISFDPLGGYSIDIDLSPDSSATSTEVLEEIKQYIQTSSKKYLLLIDEFQDIENYPDKNADVILQSLVSSLPNLICVMSSCEKRMIERLLSNKKSSFYSKLAIIELSPIDCLDYAEFVVEQFKRNNISIDEKTVEVVYNIMGGSPLFMESLFSNLFSSVEPGSNITFDTIDSEFKLILSEREFIYNHLFSNCSSRQKEYLINLAHEIRLKGSTNYITQKQLVKMDLVSEKDQRYYINDSFFRLWLRSNFPLSNNEESESNTDYMLPSQIPISKQDRDRLYISLVYLTEINWTFADERALLVQLKEILAKDYFCPNNLQFQKIKRYLINREETSLDPNIKQEIKLYIERVKP